ncbi:MAG: hypothetical protein IIA35_07345 [Proteobacteria bacterium]|nr:hypothetical protein [Pseudomonadota bacterium]
MWQNAAMNRLNRILVLALAMVLLAAGLSLAACGDKGSKTKAKKAAGVLRDYYYTTWQAPSPDWEVRKVGVTKDNVVTVSANISTKRLSKAIMERSKLEQMQIARMACPAIGDSIWSSVGKEQPVGISLSGSAGHIINARCMKPD